MNAAALPPGKPTIRVVLKGTTRTERAPHGHGNIYAPEVHREKGHLRMWYGGYGSDAHDRIHLATSDDGGSSWARRGVVLDVADANHVNDPSVVKVGGVYRMYYTVAATGIVDEIAMATSRDGARWDRKGSVLRAGPPGAWDDHLVGRPSVLHEGGVYRMWYDGRRDDAEGRAVGLAESADGVSWAKHPGNPLMGNNTGAVDVERVGDGYLMAYESTHGTNLATSPDGVSWTDLGLAIPRSGRPFDAHGHVTPMIFLGPGGRVESIYVGAARAPTWDANQVARIRFGVGGPKAGPSPKRKAVAP